MPPEGKDEIEKLKHKLYSRQNKDNMMRDVRSPLSPSDAEAPVAWQKEEPPKPPEDKRPPLARFDPPKKRMSLPAKFFIGSIIFFVLAAAAAAYMFFGGGNLISPSNIDLQIVAPSLVDSGKPESFQILINNRNTAPLSLVDLIIDYPPGTRDPADPTALLSHERQSIGTVAPGQQLKQTASAIFYGAEGAQEKVDATLEYSVAGSNAVFQKQTELPFVIGSAPISLSINAPSEATIGEQFAIDITVQSNAATPVDGAVVEAQLPFGYTYISSTPAATAGGTFWQLGTLQPGQSQVIHLVGTLDGQDGDTKVIQFLAGSNTDPTDTTIPVPLLTVPQTITVRQPFISGTISVNGQTGNAIAVNAGQPLQGTLDWKNNLSTAVSNVQLTLSFSGPALDKNSIQATTGFYQSQNSTITWSSQQEPSLAEVPPGGSGTLQFSFATLPSGAGNVLITNPTVGLTLTVNGTRVGQDNVPESVSSAASAQVSVSSMLSLTAQALHFTGPFINTGPMPPKAGSDTSYSIVWTIKNSSNTIANATVSTVLPPYIQYVSSLTSGVSYDSGSRTVTWSLGDLPAGLGYTAPAKQASFEVMFTPSTSQVGSTPALTGAAVLQGQDRFAQVTLQANAPAPTIQLTGDSGFVSGMDIVAP